jgi:hypothetical protein
MLRSLTVWTLFLLMAGFVVKAAVYGYFGDDVPLPALSVPLWAWVTALVCAVLIDCLRFANKQDVKGPRL